MGSEYPTPPREELVKLRASGMNREQIAAHYGVTLARVKRWIADMDIPSTRQRGDNRIAPSDVELGNDHGMTMIEKAKRALGPRMSQDYRGYLLDGRPVRVDMLIQAAGLSFPNER